MNPRFFGRADLWISLSRAKYDEEVDFEVRLAVAPRKQRQISKKQTFLPENFAENFCSASKNEMPRIVNAFWQSLAPIRALFEQLQTIFASIQPFSKKVLPISAILGWKSAYDYKTIFFAVSQLIVDWFILFKGAFLSQSLSFFLPIIFAFNR